MCHAFRHYHYYYYRRVITRHCSYHYNQSLILSSQLLSSIDRFPITVFHVHRLLSSVFNEHEVRYYNQQGLYCRRLLALGLINCFMSLVEAPHGGLLRAKTTLKAPFHS